MNHGQEVKIKSGFYADKTATVLSQYGFWFWKQYECCFPWTDKFGTIWETRAWISKRNIFPVIGLKNVREQEKETK